MSGERGPSGAACPECGTPGAAYVTHVCMASCVVSRPAEPRVTEAAPVPADPVVSPADTPDELAVTIRRAIQVPEAPESNVESAAKRRAAYAALAALLAVGERDRRQIARLTKRDDWLLKQIDGCIDSAETLTSAVGLSLARALVGDLRDARAVLADEEDARP